MSRKQLLALFVCQTVILTVGNGLMPLLPVLATQLGATPIVAGYYLSFSFLALAAGTIGAGWLSDRLQRRRLLLILAGVVMIPALWLMGRATKVWQLAALTATVWFCGGIGLTVIGILAGLFAEEAKRGKVFGILAMAAALGMLIGGSTTGPIVDRWGYATMFLAMSVFAILAPALGLLVQDKPVTPSEESDKPLAPHKRARLGSSYLLLLVAGLVVGIANNVGTISRSLRMSNLGLAAAAISSTGAIGGLVSLPLPPVIGWLSDRLGRKTFLIAGYLGQAVSLLILARATALWHFWVATAVNTLSFLAGRPPGTALVTDLVPPQSLGRGMSLWSASEWIAAVIGFVVGGYAFELFGVTQAIVTAAVVCVIAIGLLIPIRRPAPDAGPVPSPEDRDLSGGR
jgi:MFS family permease